MNKPDYYGTNEKETAFGRDPRYVLPLALDDANSIRYALAIGDGVLPELPKGKRNSNDQCVLARALSNGWKATVSSDETTLHHPREGKTLDDVKKSVDALRQLGWEDVGFWETAVGFAIEVPHTWAMKVFIHAFDRGDFPDLILSDEG